MKRLLIVTIVFVLSVINIFADEGYEPGPTVLFTAKVELTQKPAAISFTSSDEHERFIEVLQSQRNLSNEVFNATVIKFSELYPLSNHTAALKYCFPDSFFVINPSIEEHLTLLAADYPEAVFPADCVCRYVDVVMTTQGNKIAPYALIKLGEYYSSKINNNNRSAYKALRLYEDILSNYPDQIDACAYALEKSMETCRRLAANFTWIQDSYPLWLKEKNRLAVKDKNVIKHIFDRLVKKRAEYDWLLESGDEIIKITVNEGEGDRIKGYANAIERYSEVFTKFPGNNAAWLATFKRLVNVYEKHILPEFTLLKDRTNEYQKKLDETLGKIELRDALVRYAEYQKVTQSLSETPDYIFGDNVKIYESPFKESAEIDSVSWLDEVFVYKTNGEVIREYDSVLSRHPYRDQYLKLWNYSVMVRNNGCLWVKINYKEKSGWIDFRKLSDTKKFIKSPDNKYTAFCQTKDMGVYEHIINTAILADDLTPVSVISNMYVLDGVWSSDSKYYAYISKGDIHIFSIVDGADKTIVDGETFIITDKENIIFIRKKRAERSGDTESYVRLVSADLNGENEKILYSLKENNSVYGYCEDLCIPSPFELINTKEKVSYKIRIYENEHEDSPNFYLIIDGLTNKVQVSKKKLP